MEVYPTLTAAVSAQSPTDKRRIYKVFGIGNNSVANDKYVIATSPAQAALAFVGEDHVALVTQHDRYLAMREALHETLEQHNAKVQGGAK